MTWATSDESGTPDDWLLPPGGGIFQDTTSNDTVDVVAGPAHSGQYSLKLSNGGTSDLEGPRVYRELVDLEEAYYSAWYYLPQPYQTNSQWTIQKFRSPSDNDPDVLSKSTDLNLRTLPSGDMILYVVSHDPAYLQAPLANPPAFVPTEAWFHLEVLFRARSDETGRILVWLDDRLVYDLENRRTVGASGVQWSPCSIGQDVQPSPKVIYVDDAAISGTRVTRAGQLF
ncbi:MAG: heparin lyase I family protein [Polyangiaceae bacterium]